MSAAQGTIPQGEREELIVRHMRHFAWLFGALFFANIILCNQLARDVFVEAVNAAPIASSSEGKAREDIHVAIGRRGFAVLVLNAPVFVNLGFAARSHPPTLGPGYFTLLVLGSTYLPFFITLVLFLLVHGPGKYGMLPGMNLKS